MTKKKRQLTTSDKLRQSAAILDGMRDFAQKMMFSMNTFGVHSGRHAPHEKNFCGTTACALGTIALSGKTPLKGRWVKDRSIISYPNRKVLVITAPGQRKLSGRVSNNDPELVRHNFSAARQYYGIGSRVEQYLFGPYNADDPGLIARRMRLLAEAFEVGVKDEDDERAAILKVDNFLHGNLSGG